LASGEILKVTEAVAMTALELTSAVDASDVVIEERSMLRVLASLGTQLASYIHEINGLVGIAQAMDLALAKVLQRNDLTSAARADVRLIQGTTAELRQSIERQATYLVDVVAPDARRRRSRQSFRERFDAALRLVATQVSRRNITIKNELPPDLKSPPMFPAELTIVFSNLLTNAVKAAGNDGTIRAHSRIRDDGPVCVCLENTGVPVDIESSERWFQPFASTTAEIDTVLGQGMGLGLTITRALLEDYGAGIHFVPPSKGYATAIELDFPSEG